MMSQGLATVVANPNKDDTTHDRVIQPTVKMGIAKVKVRSE
jgi:hypothetical protein